MSDDILAVFNEELAELIETLESGLLSLDSNPDDIEIVNSVFRALHTIKGTGAMFGFTELASFIHKFETAFDVIRAGDAHITPDIIRLSLEARDQIPSLVEKQPDPYGDRERILQELANAISLSGEEDAATAPVIAEAMPEEDEMPADNAADQILRFRLTERALALGSRPAIIFEDLRKLGGHTITADLTDVPNLDALDPGVSYVKWEMGIPPVTADDLENAFMFHDVDFDLVAATAETPAPEEKLTAATSPSTPEAEEAPKPERRVEKSDRRTEPDRRGNKPEAAAGSESASSLRVSAAKLDTMLDQVGELVIAEARLAELAKQSLDPSLLSLSENITRLTAGLRSSTMNMRMLPFRSIVGRFRRLIHDTSAKLGKPVEFVVLGEDTELDKTMIEKLVDPLVHILRNSLDHGLETKDERGNTDKPATGTITLSAEHSGSEVLVRIRDDGRGLNTERIRAKAVERGLISDDAQLSDAVIHGLIFQPGFSTTEVVSDLSGRGVGMDVVKRTIDSLRGSIEVDSHEGIGTDITLRLPLTLAIVDGVLIEVGGEVYTLPMASVQEILDLPHSNDGRQEFLDVRGLFVPLLHLREVFQSTGPDPVQPVVIVVGAGTNKAGLVVDRIIGTSQTVIKQMSRLHSEVKIISGATLLGDGTIALILDVMHLSKLGKAKADAMARENAA